MEFFDLTEVAQILHIPKSRVKNWTIGRPLQITPTIRTASGKGTRNLYSVGDLYLMALANQLSEDGFAPWAIQIVVRKIRKNAPQIGKYYSSLVISSPGRRLKVEFLSGGLTTSWSESMAKQAGAKGRYTLNLETLATWVDGQIGKLPSQKGT